MASQRKDNIIIKLSDPEKIKLFTGLLLKVFTPDVSDDDVRLHLKNKSIEILETTQIGHALKCTFPGGFFDFISDEDIWLGLSRDSFRQVLNAVNTEKNPDSKLDIKLESAVLTIFADSKDKTSIRLINVREEVKNRLFVAPDTPNNATEIDREELKRKCDGIDQLFSGGVNRVNAVIVGASDNEISLSIGEENSTKYCDYKIKCSYTKKKSIKTAILPRQIKILRMFLIEEIEECEFDFGEDDWSNMAFRFFYKDGIEIIFMIPAMII